MFLEASSEEEHFGEAGYCPPSLKLRRDFSEALAKENFGGFRPTKQMEEPRTLVRGAPHFLIYLVRNNFLREFIFKKNFKKS